jgi:Protein of unknown function (DUF4012)
VGGRKDQFERGTATFVAVVAAAAGFLCAAAEASSTTSSSVGVVLAGVLGVTAAWAAATSPWWALAASAAASAVLAAGHPIAVAGTLALAAALFLGLEAWPSLVARAAIGAVVVNVLLRLPERGFHGSTAIATGCVVAVLLVTGVAHRGPAVRRRAARAAGVLIAGFAVAGAGLGWSAAAARDDLAQGVEQLREGISAVRGGNVDAAEAAFAEAASTLRSAEGTLTSSPSQLARVMPVLAEHRDAAAILTSAVAAAAHDAAQATASIDVQRLQQPAGRVDLSAIDALAAPLADVADAMAKVDAALSRASSPWLVAPVQDELAQVRTEVDDASAAIDRLRRTVALAPQMLGDTTPRRYFVAFLTGAEARPLGGFMGNWAEVVVDDGVLTMTRFGRTPQLVDGGRQPDRRVISGPPDYLDRFGHLGAGGDGRPASRDWWMNVTLSPDFPSVAQVIAELYPQSGGRPVDGVVAIDTSGIASLLDVTGPLRIEGFDRPLTAANVESFLLRDQYRVFGNEATSQRADLLEAVAHRALEQMIAQQLPAPTDLLAALRPAVDGSHLMFWAQDAAEQSLLVDAGIAGALPSPAGSDGVLVTATNVRANKLDAYLERDVAYQARFDERTGSVQGELAITLRNLAPDSGLPSHVTGDPGSSPPGTNTTQLTIHSSLEVGEVLVGDHLAVVERRMERGWHTSTFVVAVPPQGEVIVRTTTAGRIEPGRYRFLDVVRPNVGGGARSAVVETNGRRLEPPASLPPSPVRVDDR